MSIFTLKKSCSLIPAMISMMGTAKGELSVSPLNEENVRAETQGNLMEVDIRNSGIVELIQKFLLDIRSGTGSPEDLSLKRALVNELLCHPEVDQAIQRKYQELLEDIEEQIRMSGEVF